MLLVRAERRDSWVLRDFSAHLVGLRTARGLTMVEAGPGGSAGDDAHESLDSVEIIIDAFMSKFGDGALAVAIDQGERAETASKAIWREIIERLRLK